MGDYNGAEHGRKTQQVLDLLDSIAAFDDDTGFEEVEEAKQILTRLGAGIARQSDIDLRPVIKRLEMLITVSRESEVTGASFSALQDIGIARPDLADEVTGALERLIGNPDNDYEEESLKAIGAVGVSNVYSGENALRVLGKFVSRGNDANNSYLDTAIEQIGLIGKAHDKTAIDAVKMLSSKLDSDAFGTPDDALRQMIEIASAQRHAIPFVAQEFQRAAKSQKVDIDDSVVGKFSALGTLDGYASASVAEALASVLLDKRERSSFFSVVDLLEAMGTIGCAFPEQAGIHVVERLAEKLRQEPDFYSFDLAADWIGKIGARSPDAGKRALDEFASILSMPPASRPDEDARSYITMQIAHIASRQPALAERAVEILAGSLGRNSGDLKDSVTESLSSIRESDRERWNGGLKEVFRSAADRVGADKDTILVVETAVQSDEGKDALRRQAKIRNLGRQLGLD